MNIERGTLRDVVAAAVPSAVTIAAMVAVGVTYTDGDQFAQEGARTIVAVMVGFVLLASAVGLLRARSDV